MHGTQKKPEAKLTQAVRDAIDSRAPNLSRKQLEASADFVTRAQLVRKAGVRALDIDNINVWGEWKPEPAQRPHEGGGQDLILRLSEPSCIVLLNDNAINGMQKPDLLFVGYGDASGCYGAGPTRDLRRATYGPRLIAVLPDVHLATKGLLSFKPTDFVRQLAARIDAIDGVGNANVGVTNLSLEKGGPFSTGVDGDIVLLLNHPHASGHAFLPENVRQTSPLYGDLRTVGVSIDGCGKALRGWIEGAIVKLKETLGGILPAGQKADVVGIVTIDNT